MMAVWSITSSSSLIVSGRIDGEYYSPTYLKNESILSQIRTIPLPQVFFVSDGNHLTVSKHFTETEGVPYFRGQDINDFFIENASPVRIPDSVYSSSAMERSHFQAGDVLLSIVGTIGSLSIIPDPFHAATGSCKIAVLRSKGEYSAPFLAAFLLSQYG
jgi:type I restriction enzyme, S subunit